MKNLEPIERKITELERKITPDIIRVWIVDEENNQYRTDGRNYTKAEYEAMTAPDDTVIIISRTDKWND
jgi:hypothetical protein